jgi:hypothetical protein
MSSSFAAITRQQLPPLQTTIADLGAIQFVSFKEVGPGGAAIYEVNFEKGALECGIALGADGKVEGAGIRPQRPCRTVRQLRDRLDIVRSEAVANTLRRSYRFVVQTADTCAECAYSASRCDAD